GVEAGREPRARVAVVVGGEAGPDELCPLALAERDDPTRGGAQEPRVAGDRLPAAVERERDVVGRERSGADLVEQGGAACVGGEPAAGNLAGKGHRGEGVATDRVVRRLVREAAVPGVLHPDKGR